MELQLQYSHNYDGLIRALIKSAYTLKCTCEITRSNLFAVDSYNIIWHVYGLIELYFIGKLAKCMHCARDSG